MPDTTTPKTPSPAARLLVCACQDTMTISPKTLASALGLPGEPAIHRDLCRGQLESYRRAIETAGSVQIACTQEAPLFLEVAAEAGRSTDDLIFTNIRERAGWCDNRNAAAPKMAALLAEAAVASTPTRTVTLTSDGRCLVYGHGQTVLDAATKLAGRMSVTIMLTDAADALPPATGTAPIVKGRIRSVRGRIGAFELEVDGYAAALPSSRGKLDFEMPRNGARTTCDVILDLSDGKALFDEHARREGYVRANPTDRAAIAEAIFIAADLSGEFEKPIFVDYDAAICAHSRSGKVGCSKCLSVCPTGAITPNGDHVALDQAICAGCGNCAAVCPTGAANYGFPARATTLNRLKALLQTYARAGGANPIVLVHDDDHGRPLIDMLARQGNGLPPNVLPFATYAITGFGHDMLAATLALGAHEVIMLGNPKNAVEHHSLQSQIELLGAITAGLGFHANCASIITTSDPDTLAASLTGRAAVPAIGPLTFATEGTKRDVSRTVLSALHAKSPLKPEWLPLPESAPYGRILIKADGCTLCLACVGACPANALADNPERPELSFTEAACVQCGICVATCPESVITLEHGYNFATAALAPAVLKTEQPFHCVSCNKPFGTKSTVDRVIAKLQGKHAMFQNPEQVRLIQMCDNCRVIALSERGNDPMRMGTVPRVRTTQDYLDAENAAKADGKPKKIDDFLS